MPNWAYHTLKISGSKEDILALKNLVTSKTNIYTGKKELNVLNTNKLIPYPKKYLDLDINPKTRKIILGDKQYMSIEGKDGYNSGGYDWCCQNWGTKWGVCRAEICSEDLKESGRSNIVYSFETAWSPGVQVIMKMSELFPMLGFDWYCEEESLDFKFKCLVKKGKILKETSLLKDD